MSPDDTKKMAIANGHPDPDGWAEKVRHVFETGQLPLDLVGP
jgi:hypothetical protein